MSPGPGGTEPWVIRAERGADPANSEALPPFVFGVDDGQVSGVWRGAGRGARRREGQARARGRRLRGEGPEDIPRIGDHGPSTDPLQRGSGDLVRRRARALGAPSAG